MKNLVEIFEARKIEDNKIIFQNNVNMLLKGPKRNLFISV